jgi:hypothetical protein
VEHLDIVWDCYSNESLKAQTQTPQVDRIMKRVLDKKTGLDFYKILEINYSYFAKKMSDMDTGGKKLYTSRVIG